MFTIPVKLGGEEEKGAEGRMMIVRVERRDYVTKI